MKRLRLLGSVCALSLLSNPAMAVGILYFNEDNTGLLHTLNTSSGLATTIGATGTFSHTVGLSPSSDPNVLYGSTWTDLSHINSDGSGFVTVGNIAQEGLAYDPFTGTLYGSINGNFTTHNPVDGSLLSTLTAPGADVEGIAFGNGLIYGIAGGYASLFAYDPNSDHWSLVGDTGILWSNTGLAYDTDLNLLYAKGSQDTFLYQISPSTAAVSIIGDTLLNAGGGLAYISAVPIPAALWLFGSGLLGLVGIARKKAA